MSLRSLLATVPPLGVALVAAAAATALFGKNIYLHEMLILAVIYAQFAASWDLLCGCTELDNFGHALFIGGAAYGSALLGRQLGLAPWLSVPVAAGLAALAGAAIGALTLRLRGPYFSLATIAFAALSYKLAYILSGITGGEEGLSGLRSFTGSVETDLLVCLAVFSLSFLAMHAFNQSSFGLILRSTRHNEDAAMAAGFNTAYYKVVAFVLSGFLAGVGGALYGHTQMQANPELLSGGLSVMIVLLATVGGRGTLIGPAIAAGLLMLVNEWLRVLEQYRVVIFTGLLIVLVYLNPAGFANSRWLQRWPWLRRLLLPQQRRGDAP